MKINASQIPGANQLYIDYMMKFKQVAKYYQHDYAREQSIYQQIDAIRERNFSRAELTSVLHQQNKKFGAGDKTLENIDRLSHDNVFAIVTGQQVGLFGGPLFTLYKALTAVKLVDRLSRSCTACFVPIFWLATDDADFAEVNHITVLDRDYQPQRIELSTSRQENQPMSATTIGEEINEVFAILDELTLDTEFKEEIMHSLREAYQPGVTMGDAFGKWLMSCLKQFGVVLLDPSAPELRKLYSEIFAREISAKSPSTEAMLQRSAQLDDDGYPQQIAQRDGRLNVFYMDGERHSLELSNGTIGFTDGSQSFSEEELHSLAKTQPEKFSPNVVLRALTQDYMLPTVAYIAGPAEIAYFAQLGGVYRAFDMSMPIIYPRKSVTLLEPTIDRILDKYSLDIPALWGDVEQLITSFARDALPESLMQTLTDLQTDWPATLRNLRDQIVEVDPTLEKMLENTSGRIDNTLGHLEKKVIQAGKRKQELLRNQLHKVSSAVYPNHHLQERELNFVPFMFKFGPYFIERLYELLDISSFEHQIIRL